MSIKVGLIAALLFLSMGAYANVALTGDVPYSEIHNLQKNLDQIWQHVSSTYLLTDDLRKNVVPPQIEFKEFDHPDEATFLEFHYAGTNRIQVSPSRTFLRYYQNDPYGMKSETVGYGFYVTTHEMLHYVLESDGIPGRLHHCLFISEKNGHSLMSDLTQYLIDQKISAPLVRNVGFDFEKGLMPCEALSPEDRALVQQYLDTSKLWSPELALGQ